jgi:hypothetical protein
VKSESFQINRAVSGDNALFGEALCLGTVFSSDVRSQYSPGAEDAMARTGGVMVVMQREVPDPGGGDSVSQGVGQIAASRHPAGRHLRQEVA